MKFHAFERRNLKCTTIARSLVLPKSPFTVPSGEMNYLPLQLQLTLNRLPSQSLLALMEGESKMLITRRYRREVTWLGVKDKWSVGTKLLLERRNKFWFLLYGRVTMVNSFELYIPKQLGEKILNVFNTEK